MVQVLVLTYLRNDIHLSPFSRLRPLVVGSGDGAPPVPAVRPGAANGRERRVLVPGHRVGEAGKVIQERGGRLPDKVCFICVFFIKNIFGLFLAGGF